MKMKQFSSFKDAGRDEIDNAPIAEKTSSKTKRIKTFGKITVDRDNFPYLKEKEIGEKCTLLIEIRKVEESVAEDWETDKSDKVRIEILRIAEPKEVDEYKEVIKDNA